MKDFRCVDKEINVETESLFETHDFALHILVC